MPVVGARRGDKAPGPHQRHRTSPDEDYLLSNESYLIGTNAAASGTEFKPPRDSSNRAIGLGPLLRCRFRRALKSRTAEHFGVSPAIFLYWSRLI